MFLSLVFSEMHNKIILTLHNTPSRMGIIRNTSEYMAKCPAGEKNTSVLLVRMKSVEVTVEISLKFSQKPRMRPII